jgi:UDP-2,3-diacylglucosamine pyrophosphatase LpxH
MANQYKPWSGKDLEAAKKILARCATIDEALPELSRLRGAPVTTDRLRGAFNRADQQGPSYYLRGGVSEDSRMVELVKLVRSGPVKFGDLCDKLDLSPSRARSLISAARARGSRFRVDGDHVGLDLSAPPSDRVRDVKIAPVVGQRQSVAVISDTHLGSKYCLRAQLRDFVEAAYERGVREVLHPGDVVDGVYRHSRFEQTHVGLEEQARDLFEVLPRKKGLTYHGITGNHDFTFTEESGVDVGRYLSDYFRRRGRDDLRFYGDRGAHLKIRGARIHLWHPSGGVAYALSYKMQKKIEGYSSAEKPAVLLIGHWHRAAYIFERGVHAVACGTFQGGGSAFSKSLTMGAPAIGGTILSWQATRDGTLRDFSVERRTYFEVEVPYRVEDDTLGIAIK